MKPSLPAFLKANPDLAVSYGDACKLARDGVSGIEAGPGGYGWVVTDEDRALNELMSLAAKREPERT